MALVAGIGNTKTRIDDSEAERGLRILARRLVDRDMRIVLHIRRGASLTGVLTSLGKAIASQYPTLNPEGKRGVDVDYEVVADTATTNTTDAPAKGKARAT